MLTLNIQDLQPVRPSSPSAVASRVFARRSFLKDMDWCCSSRRRVLKKYTTTKAPLSSKKWNAYVWTAPIGNTPSSRMIRPLNHIFNEQKVLFVGPWAPTSIQTAVVCIVSTEYSYNSSAVQLLLYVLLWYTKRRRRALWPLVGWLAEDRLLLLLLHAADLFLCCPARLHTSRRRLQQHSSARILYSWRHKDIYDLVIGTPGTQQYTWYPVYCCTQVELRRNWLTGENVYLLVPVQNIALSIWLAFVVFLLCTEYSVRYFSVLPWTFVLCRSGSSNI